MLEIVQTLFESSVISYGSQTELAELIVAIQFESSVISYGSQTNKNRQKELTSLRVV